MGPAYDAEPDAASAPASSPLGKSERPPLFEFLCLIASAAARKKLTAREAAVASYIAIDTTDDTSGLNGYLAPQRVADELGISPRTVQRLFYDVLVSGGWFEKTSEARRGRPGVAGSGRRARYRLGFPVIDLGLLDGASELSGSLARHTDSDGMPPVTVDLTRQDSTPAAMARQNGAYGTTELDAWHATKTLEGGARLPSDGSPPDCLPTAHPTASTTDRARAPRMDERASA